jgi:hypothetical protein
MEHRGEADPDAEMLFVGGDGEHGLGAGFEQQGRASYKEGEP